MESLYQWGARTVLPQRVRNTTDNLYTRFMEGLQCLTSGKDVLMIFVTSIVIWLLETVKYWFVMHAFDFEVSFLVLMLMNGLVNLATTLPSAPGYIGTFDTPGIETLAAFGVDRNLAASYTFTLHAALWLPVTLVGGWFFWRCADEVERLRRRQAGSGAGRSFGHSRMIRERMKIKIEDRVRRGDSEIDKLASVWLAAARPRLAHNTRRALHFMFHGVDL